MPANQPYDPRYNAKIYVPKQTEEERRARATPLENLKGLRYRTESPAPPANIPVPAESAPQPHVLPDNVEPTEIPVPDSTPTEQEGVLAESPKSFKKKESRATLDDHEVEERIVSAHCCADAHVEKPVQHTGADIAKAPAPSSALAYEEDDILAYANVISFYSRPRRNTSAPKATRQRSGGPCISMSPLPYRSSG